MFKISIFTMEGLIYSGTAREVSLPQEEEQLTILDFHHPLIARLTKGEINIDRSKYLNIVDGIAYFNNNELEMMVGIDQGE